VLNYDRYGNRTHPSSQIEEDCDGTLLFSKYLCEGDERCMHSIGDTWWGTAFSSLNKDGLVLRCKESHLGTVSAFFGALYPFALRRISHDAKYPILGRAYVGGLVGGEVFDLHDFEKRGYDNQPLLIGLVLHSLGFHSSALHNELA
jgi:hypothetical protein